jgi:hypothetical protein
LKGIFEQEDDTTRSPSGFASAVKMSLRYGLGGATTALTVVGACKMSDAGLTIWTDLNADMLFTGDGEAFNVRSMLGDSARMIIDVRNRSDNFLKTYHRTPGQV